jgi:hypothetical protein
MPAVERAAVDVRGSLAPGFENVERRREPAPAAPKCEERARDLLREISLVVPQVDARRGAIVLASGVDGRGVLETADIFGDRVRRNCR